MPFEQHEPTERANRSSDQSSVYASIAANCWTRPEMHSSRSAAPEPSSLDLGNQANLYGTDYRAPIAQLEKPGAFIKFADKQSEARSNDQIIAQAQSTASEIQIRENVKTGVSKVFKDNAEAWIHNKVPRHTQQLVHDNDIGLTIYANSAQIPQNIREQHARRHKDEIVGNLNMFYDPSTRAMVFVEHPEKAAQQKHTQEVQAHGGIQNFQYGPNEETAWHELGHALDFGALKHITTSKEFDDAFHKGLPRLSEEDREDWKYYVEPDKFGNYQAAKEELFAQIFCLENKSDRDKSEQDMMDKFNEAVSVMKKHLAF